MKYLIAYALFNKQFTFFTGSTVFLQHSMCRLLHEQRNIAAMCRTYTYTAHAGDTDFLIHIFRILQINSLAGQERAQTPQELHCPLALGTMLVSPLFR